MSSHEHASEGPRGFRLTPDCEVLQARIVAVVAALDNNGAAEDEWRRARFLQEVQRIRHHLRGHVERVEDPAGLFDAVALGAPQLVPELTTLCEEHAEMDRCLEELEQRLEGRDTAATDPAAAAAAIRRAAAALGEVLRRHQSSACRLARSAGSGEAAEPQ